MGFSLDVMRGLSTLNVGVGRLSQFEAIIVRIGLCRRWARICACHSRRGFELESDYRSVLDSA